MTQTLTVQTFIDKELESVSCRFSTEKEIISRMKALFRSTSQLNMPKETIKYIFVNQCEKNNVEVLKHMLSSDFPYNIRDKKSKEIIVEGLEQSIMQGSLGALTYLMTEPRLKINEEIKSNHNSYYNSFLGWAFCYSATQGKSDNIKILIEHNQKYQLIDKSDTSIAKAFALAIKRSKYDIAGELLNAFVLDTRSKSIEEALSELKRRKGAAATTILTQLEKNFLSSQIQNLIPTEQQVKSKAYKI